MWNISTDDLILWRYDCEFDLPDIIGHRKISSTSNCMEIRLTDSDCSYFSYDGFICSLMFEWELQFKRSQRQQERREIGKKILNLWISQQCRHTDYSISLFFIASLPK